MGFHLHKTWSFQKQVLGWVRKILKIVVKQFDKHLGIRLTRYFLLLAFFLFWLWEAIKHFVNMYMWESLLLWFIAMVVVSLYDWYFHSDE